MASCSSCALPVVRAVVWTQPCACPRRCAFSLLGTGEGKRALFPSLRSPAMPSSAKRRSLQLYRSWEERFIRAGSDQDGQNVAPEIPAEEELRSPGPLPPGETPKLSYGFITGLAAVGLVEAGYLTWAKLSGESVFCPVGSSGCSDVLNSDYATVFGVPLPVIGMVSYGAVFLLALLGLKGEEEEEHSAQRWLVLGCTSGMAVASAYFIYILTVKLEGASCTYCFSSALLCFSLLLATLRGFTSTEMQKVLGLQAAVAASVVVALSVAFSDANAALARLASIDLPLVQPQVLRVSSPREISLAKHLQSIGAKMYGAFWCSHCLEQKEMFGHEAMKYVNYVECYPEGYRKGVTMASACKDAKIEGFPTWVINGEVMEGELELADLARVSGFDSAGAEQQ